MKTRLLALACVLSLLFVGVESGRSEQGPGAWEITGDVFVARPACLVATVVGSAIFVVALPFAAMSKSVKQTAQSLVVKPARATFVRPVGDLGALGQD